MWILPGEHVPIHLSPTWLQNILIFHTFSWFFSRLWACEIGATIDSNELSEAWKPTLLGLRKTIGSIWVFWLKLWIWILFLLDLFTRQGQPASIACSSPPVLVCIWKKNSSKYSKIRYTHLWYWEETYICVEGLSETFPFLELWKGKGWLARNFVKKWLPPLLWYRSFSISTRKRESSLCHVCGGHHGRSWERLHLRTSSVFRLPVHVTFCHMCFKKESSFHPPPEPTVATNDQEEPLQVETWLYKIHLKKLQKTLKFDMAYPNLPWLGRKHIYFHAH